ncbi:hypothetical protein MML48_9g00012176 [Holotrichia oblita]|uniref:Uncharacterized protein n=1 Tax=Holotrichia oblita TaxID=644536 RepID=A0ACB9ST08_HOLOL|nr:hypothetical protein MML48_9g00012176 [Holotrichia oblita]
MKVAMSDWMRTYPGRPITIAEIAQLCGKAYLSAFTAKNILSGFCTPGLWPLDQLALGEDAFQPSKVTDQSLSSTSEVTDQQSSSAMPQTPVNLEEPQPGPSSGQQLTKAQMDQTPKTTSPKPTIVLRQQLELSQTASVIPTAEKTLTAT